MNQSKYKDSREVKVKVSQITKHIADIRRNDKIPKSIVDLMNCACVNLKGTDFIYPQQNQLDTSYAN